MATLTIPEKTTATEHRHPTGSQVGLLTREEFAEVEAEIAIILAPTSPAVAPAFPQRENLMARIVRPFVSLYRELSGPPMAKRDRQARDLAETRFHNYTGLTGF